MRRNDLIWLRRIAAGILIIVAIWFILIASVGLAAPFVRFG